MITGKVNKMEDIELKKKREKAKKYVEEPERFTVDSIELIMNSTHDKRIINYNDGKWSCTCDFYDKRGVCSHIFAAKELIFEKIKFKSKP